MNAAVSAFVGAGLISKLQVEAGRCSKNADRYFLVRQLEYFRCAYNECKCVPAHSCGGCTVLYEIGIALGEVTAAQREGPQQIACEHEGDKSRMLWFSERRDLGVERAKVQERARRMKLSAQERREEDEEKKRKPPEEKRLPRDEQMEIGS